METLDDSVDNDDGADNDNGADNDDGVDNARFSWLSIYVHKLGVK